MNLVRPVVVDVGESSGADVRPLRYAESSRRRWTVARICYAGGEPRVVHLEQASGRYDAVELEVIVAVSAGLAVARVCIRVEDHVVKLIVCTARWREASLVAGRIRPGYPRQSVGYELVESYDSRGGAVGPESRRHGRHDY